MLTCALINSSAAPSDTVILHYRNVLNYLLITSRYQNWKWHHSTIPFSMSTKF